VEGQASTTHAISGRQLAAVAAASILIVSASVAVPACYLRAHMVDDDVVAVPEPPVAPRMFFPPTVVVPSPESADQMSKMPDAAPGPVVTAADGGNYTIVVASFTNSERAQRLVEELTTAGYRARVVEHDWGPPRGRLLQVNVGGYASVTEGQHDLEQIRQLPGGYHDARIVERQ
jgi:cell division septation protein DedD